MKGKIKGILFDVSGVLEFQGTIYPGAIELLSLLRERGITVRLLSNSTLQSRRSYSEILSRKGLVIDEDEVVTASFATARYLKSLKPRSGWVWLEGKGREEFEGFLQTEKDPEYIILGDFREGFNFHNLNRAVELIQNGSRLIVMITEMVDRSLGGVELTVGAYGRMLEEATGTRAVYVGKPHKYIFEVALQTMDLDPDQVLMVGDKVSTDIRGAVNAGIKSILVKTGEFIESDLNKGITPDYICASITEAAALLDSLT